MPTAGYWKIRVAFGDINTFYLPVEGESFDQPWGNRIRSLNAVASAGSDSSTQVTHPSNQLSDRTVRPYINSQAGGQVEYGWAVRVPDMGSAAGALRAIRAGLHTVTLYIAAPLAGTANSCQLRIYVRRVAAADAPTPYLRTLLGTAAADFSTFGGEASVSLSLPEIVFAPGETIQYDLRTQIRAGILQSVYTLVLGTSGGLQGNVPARIDHPGLVTIAPTRGAAAGSAFANSFAANALGTRGAAQGSSASSSGLRAIAGLVGAAGGVAQPHGAFAGAAEMVGVAAGASVAEGELAGAGAMDGTATGTSAAHAALAGAAAVVGSSSGACTADGELAGTGGLVGSAEGNSDASGGVGAVAGLVGLAEGESAVLAQLAALRGTVGTSLVGEGGEPQPLPPGILRLRPDGRYEALMNGQSLPPGAVRLTTV